MAMQGGTPGPDAAGQALKRTSAHRGLQPSGSRAQAVPGPAWGQPPCLEGGLHFPSHVTELSKFPPGSKTRCQAQRKLQK